MNQSKTPIIAGLIIVVVFIAGGVTYAAKHHTDQIKATDAAKMAESEKMKADAKMKTDAAMKATPSPSPNATMTATPTSGAMKAGQ